MFKITVNDLCNEQFSKYDINNLSDEDSLLVNKYHMLDAHAKELINMIIDKELERIMTKN